MGTNRRWWILYPCLWYLMLMVFDFVISDLIVSIYKLDMLSDETLISFLTECGIVCSSIDLLDGYQINRDILIDNSRYENIKNFIPDLKKQFSSSSLTSLHAGAEENQRWPLINIVRQILKSCNYQMCPKRISDGYTASGKKKYRRVFEVHKFEVHKFEVIKNEEQIYNSD